MSQLPDMQRLRELLAPWATRTAFVIPMTNRRGELLGNNGDRLMHAVFGCILEELRIAVTQEQVGAELIIVPPNGALLEMYEFPRILAERLRGLEDVPLVIFPSSAFFPQIDPSFVFAGRRAATLWILREQHSYDHLRSTWGASLARLGVTLELDHDVVASAHHHLPRVIPGALASHHLLIASRLDGEALEIRAGAPASAPQPALKKALASIVRSSIPYGRARTFIGRMSRLAENRALGAKVMAAMPSDMTEQLRHAEVPVVSVDVSLPSLATFAEYSDLIRSAAMVVTNRLHVALPAAFLGKEVCLLDSGYHKLRGVYERSLRDMRNVRLVSQSRH